MKQGNKRIWTYVIFVAIALGIGILSAVLNAGKQQTPNLIQPPLSPPSWLFPIVWAILFFLMGVSAARVYLSEDPQRRDALFVWATQLVVNFLWTVFYFQFQALLLSFFWLLPPLMGMIVRFRRVDRIAGNLNIPYLLWLCFAGYLNLATFLINR